MTRRRFMHGLATTAGALFAGPYVLRAAEVNKEKLRIAFVGTGGQAHSHIPLAATESCPCYADVDKKHWDLIGGLAPAAASYTDYRKMFDKHEKEIDAVVVTVPDHSHAAASLRAIRAGKHCYTEKPLTWCIAEARALAEAATEYKVATQMGNMGHANEGNRRVVEWVRGGVIGDVLETHSWTNRPVWPQGPIRRPPPQPVPENLDWDVWIGPAPYREYHKGLHPFDWRGWFDFGSGAIGDMGCHTWDCVFWSLAPDYPSSVEVVRIEGKGEETYPSKCQIKWTFPSKGARPAFVSYWYEGGLKPPVPEEIVHDPYWQPKTRTAGTQPADTQPSTAPDEKPGEVTLPKSGSLFIGTKGKLLVQGDYGDSPRLIPETFMKQAKRPPKSIPRSPGHKEEWLLACRGEKPLDFPGTNFPGYGGPLTEVMLLGAMAIKLTSADGDGDGVRIECDPEGRTIKTPAARALVGREYRKGWEL